MSVQECHRRYLTDGENRSHRHGWLARVFDLDVAAEAGSARHGGRSERLILLETVDVK